MSRVSKDIFFMKLAYQYAEQSTCVRRKVGCVIVRNNTQLSGGYNGVPTGLQHCTDETCIRKKLNIPSGQQHEKCRGAHSEMNAISQAAKNGVNIDGSTIYCTTQPCIYCAKAIVNSGIKRLVYCESYGNGMDSIM